MRSRAFTVICAIALLAAAAAAGEPDWFTRVKEMGLVSACEQEVERHARGVLPDSLHVGRCYYDLGRWGDGAEVFKRLVRSPDENYAAEALAKRAEGLYHLGEIEAARRAFTSCLERYPEAWLDGSVSERCRAWLKKLDGGLESPEPADDAPSVSSLREEVKALETRLKELRELIDRLSEGDGR